MENCSAKQAFPEGTEDILGKYEGSTIDNTGIFSHEYKHFKETNFQAYGAFFAFESVRSFESRSVGLEAFWPHQQTSVCRRYAQI